MLPAALCVAEANSKKPTTARSAVSLVTISQRLASPGSANGIIAGRDLLAFIIRKPGGDDIAAGGAIGEYAGWEGGMALMSMSGLVLFLLAERHGGQYTPARIKPALDRGCALLITRLGLRKFSRLPVTTKRWTVMICRHALRNSSVHV